MIVCTCCSMCAVHRQVTEAVHHTDSGLGNTSLWLLHGILDHTVDRCARRMSSLIDDTT